MSIPTLIYPPVNSSNLSVVSRGEESYYTGVQAVRLPMKAKGTVPVDQPFRAVTEKRGKGDPEGTIVGGPERNVFRVYELHGDPESCDTLKNTVDPQAMLHGQSRRLELDENYFTGFVLNSKFSRNRRIQQKCGCQIQLVSV